MTWGRDQAIRRRGRVRGAGCPPPGPHRNRGGDPRDRESGGMLVMLSDGGGKSAGIKRCYICPKRNVEVNRLEFGARTLKFEGDRKAQSSCSGLDRIRTGDLRRVKAMS